MKVRKTTNRKPKNTKASTRIARAIREVIEHLEGKRALRTTIVYVDRTPGKEKVVARSKAKRRKHRRSELARASQV